MPSYAVTAIGSDRPGIVAAVTQALYEAGCNIEDSSMTLLRGNFAIMLVLAAPDELEVDALERALRPVCENLGLLFSVEPVDDRHTTPAPTHVLTVYGGDKPGIVHAVTDVLATREANITDLASRLVGDETPVYALQLELELAGTDADELAAALHDVGSRMGVDVVLNERETDVL